MTNRVAELKQQITILERAYTAADRSMVYWDAIKRYEGDEEMQNNMWAECCYHGGMAKGLLFAYEALTGIPMFNTPTYIKRELEERQSELTPLC